MDSDHGRDSDDNDRHLVPGGSSLPAPPFQDLLAPTPHAPDPPPAARWAAFAAIAIGGVLGLLIGYGIGDLMSSNATWAAIGAFVGAATGAGGVGVVANLTLRAMGEWNEVEHLEGQGPDGASL